MKIHSTYLPGLILLMLTSTSCREEAGGDLNISANSKINVSYGADPLQRMDYYLPENRSQQHTRALVLIHGGAWSGGDKSEFNAYVDTLRRRFPEYAVFNINYRLATTTSNTFPAQEDDVKAAMNFIYTNRTTFNISDRFVLLGASAGAHLAMLQGYKNKSAGKIEAIINFFGPSNMSGMFTNPPPGVNPLLISLLVGGTPTTNPKAYHDSSPINFVDAQSPPTLTFQGSKDPLVSPSQQVALHQKLTSAGVPNEYVLYPDEAHGWFGLSLSRSFNSIESFLKAHVN